MSKRNASALAYTVFALRAVCVVQGISTTSVVKLTCGGLNPMIQKCIGTYILPNTLLTTSMCAENCQYVENLPIMRKFIHKHYKNYVRRKGVLLRNDIALLVTNTTKRKIVRLSVLDDTSPLGQKGLVPIMDKNGPKLQVAIIQRCDAFPNKLEGPYVCTSKAIAKEATRTCKEKEEQGTPLLLDDKIYGIMSLRSEDDCNIPQRKFTAVGPALSWVSSVARVLASNYQAPILRLRSQSDDENQLIADSSFSSAESNVSSTESEHNQTLHSSTEEITDKSTKNEQLVTYFVTKKSLDLIDQKLAQLKDYAPNSFILRDGSTTSNMSRPVRSFGATAITFKPRPRPRRTTKLQKIISTPHKNITIHVIPFVKDLGNNKSTNIMDWFRDEVKRMDDYPRYLVLSSTPTTKRAFIDLT